MSATPRLVDGIPSAAMDVVCGASHSGIQTATGELWTLGSQKEGCLGQGSAKGCCFGVPQKVLFERDCEVVSVSSGLYHMAAIVTTVQKDPATLASGLGMIHALGEAAEGIHTARATMLARTGAKPRELLCVNPLWSPGHTPREPPPLSPVPNKQAGDEQLRKLNARLLEERDEMACELETLKEERAAQRKQNEIERQQWGEAVAKLTGERDEAVAEALSLGQKLRELVTAAEEDRCTFATTLGTFRDAFVEVMKERKEAMLQIPKKDKQVNKLPMIDSSIVFAPLSATERAAVAFRAARATPFTVAALGEDTAAVPSITTAAPTSMHELEQSAPEPKAQPEPEPELEPKSPERDTEAESAIPTAMHELEQSRPEAEAEPEAAEEELSPLSGGESCSNYPKSPEPAEETLLPSLWESGAWSPALKEIKERLHVLQNENEQLLQPDNDALFSDSLLESKAPRDEANDTENKQGSNVELAGSPFMVAYDNILRRMETQVLPKVLPLGGEAPASTLPFGQVAVGIHRSEIA